MEDTGLFDRGILALLRDGKSRNFQQILSEVGFSPNTLRLHLANLVEQGPCCETEKASAGPWETQVHLRPAQRR